MVLNLHVITGLLCYSDNMQCLFYIWPLKDWWRSSLGLRPSTVKSYKPWSQWREKKDCFPKTHSIAIWKCIISAWRKRDLLHLFSALIACLLKQKNSTVRILNLSSSGLTDEMFSYVGDVLSVTKSLSELYAANNKLGTLSAQKLQKSLEHNRYVTELDYYQLPYYVIRYNTIPYYTWLRYTRN